MDDPDDVVRMAEANGCRRPVYGRMSNPALWACWAHRVRLVDAMRTASVLREMARRVADADLYAGHPPLPLHTVEATLSAFVGVPATKAPAPLHDGEVDALIAEIAAALDGADGSKSPPSIEAGP